MLFSTADVIKTPVLLVRLFFHEAERVYKDKLVDQSDIEMYDKFTTEILAKNFEV